MDKWTPVSRHVRNGAARPQVRSYSLFGASAREMLKLSTYEFDPQKTRARLPTRGEGRPSYSLTDRRQFDICDSDGFPESGVDCEGERSLRFRAARQRPEQWKRTWQRRDATQHR